MASSENSREVSNALLVLLLLLVSPLFTHLLGSPFF